MMTKPFKIESIPAGKCNWIVIPSPDREEIQVRIEIGESGDGPLVCEADWIPHRYERVEGSEVAAPGFVAWHVEGDTIFTAPPWMPAAVMRAVQEAVIWLYTEQQKAKAVGA